MKKFLIVTVLLLICSLHAAWAEGEEENTDEDLGFDIIYLEPPIHRVHSPFYDEDVPGNRYDDATMSGPATDTNENDDYSW